MIPYDLIDSSSGLRVNKERHGGMCVPLLRESVMNDLVDRLIY